VHDEVKSLAPERVDSGGREPAELAPAVVEVGGAVGEPEPGQVERDAAQAAAREFASTLR
jgi:hypothetical protein